LACVVSDEFCIYPAWGQFLSWLCLNGAYAVAVRVFAASVEGFARMRAVFGDAFFHFPPQRGQRGSLRICST
jgi:hypothetical protein